MLVQKKLAGYMDFFNYERPHQALKYHTPAEMYYNQIGYLDKPRKEKSLSKLPYLLSE